MYTTILFSTQSPIKSLSREEINSALDSILPMTYRAKETSAQLDGHIYPCYMCIVNSKDMTKIKELIFTKLHQVNFIEFLFTDNKALFHSSDSTMIENTDVQFDIFFLELEDTSFYPRQDHVLNKENACFFWWKEKTTWKKKIKGKPKKNLKQEVFLSKFRRFL